MPWPANDIASVLTRLTVDKLSEMKPADRQLLRDQCERVCRIIEADRIVDGAPKASRPRHKVGVLLQAWETD
jgi:hypothetical protein